MPWRRAWQPTPVFLPGKSPWAEEPGGLQSMGSQRGRQDWATKHSTAQTGRQQSRWPLHFSAVRPQAIEFSFQLTFKKEKEKQGCHGGMHVQKFRLGKPGTRVSRSLDCTTEPRPTAEVSWSESHRGGQLWPGRPQAHIWLVLRRSTVAHTLHGLLFTSAEPVSPVCSQVWRGV